MRAVLPPLLPEEGHEPQPAHIESGESGPDEGADAQDIARGAPLVERDLDNLVLGEIAGRPGESDDREITAGEGGEGDGHDAPQPAVPPHVDLVIHAVHDRAGAEEHVGLEETVRDQVQDRDRIAGRADAGRQEHIADLADGGVGQDLLDVVLGAAADAAVEQRHRADTQDHGARGHRLVEDRVAAADQVDAGGDHGRRVDEGRDRSRALHGVGQPGLQGELARLAARAEQQHQADAGRGRVTKTVGAGEDSRIGGGSQGREHQHDGDRETDVTDAVHDESLLGRGRCCRLIEPESNQQVRRKTDALPADVEQEVAVTEDEQQHRGDEEVEITEEASAARVVLHIADGVDVDQRADAGDQQHEHHGELVEQQTRLHMEPVDRDPGEQVVVDAAAGA